jgi:hypothetical protein
MQPVIKYPKDINPLDAKAGRTRRCVWRAYRNDADRKRAIAQLRKRGFSYFACYTDVKGLAVHAYQER